jgi:antagonist of KipI
MSLHVLRPGMLTTVQDLGRPGLQRAGIPVGGAMDRLALRVANLLVGNDSGEAALEITLLGPTLRFQRDATIAVCGGDLAPAVNGIPLPQQRPVQLVAGSVLSFGSARGGCRAYLAAAGGFDLPEVMGSRSTYLPARFGGHQGRALRAGDVLPLRGTCPSPPYRMPTFYGDLRAPRWSAGLRRDYAVPVTVRVVRGPEFTELEPASRDRVFTQEFEVTSHSDRMGYRLLGTPLAFCNYREMLSRGVSCGMVQVPPTGCPLVLMADCATTGGYPRVAQVIAVDLPLMAQLKPGDTLQFQEVTLEEAHALYRRQEEELARLALGLRLKREEWK